MASNSKNLAELLNSDVTLTATDIANDAVTTAKIADGAITPAKTAGIGGGGKNVIVNGEMVISQRQTSSSNVGNQYVLDRFAVYKQNTGSTYTCSQNNVTDLAGFSKSLKMDCTTADTSLAANEQVYIVTKLEGQECQRFAKGHGSDALPMTLSFYVKTNKTGVYTVSIFDRDNTRKVNGSYTVANANWARYSITFPADASGKLDNDNASSLELFFNLVAGADTNTGSLYTSWASSVDAGSATGQVNFADSTSNDWEITGIQLETGSAATPFEHRSINDHLSACHRYYYHHASGTTSFMGGGDMYVNTQLNCNIKFPETMRATPSLVATSGSNYYLAYGGATSTNMTNAWNAFAFNTQNATLYGTPTVNVTAGTGMRNLCNHASASVAFNAEL